MRLMRTRRDLREEIYTPSRLRLRLPSRGKRFHPTSSTTSKGKLQPANKKQSKHQSRNKSDIHCGTAHKFIPLLDLKQLADQLVDQPVNQQGIHRRLHLPDSRHSE